MFPRYEDLNINRRLVWILRDIGHVMRQISEGKGSQKRVLSVLLESGPVTQTALTEHLRIQPGSASEVLGRLEELGLIVRTANEVDKRTVNVALTEAGEVEAKAALDQRNKRHTEMFSALSEEERKQLLYLLEKLTDDWVTRYGAVLKGGKRKQ